MAKPVLDQPEVVLLVRQREAAGMAQHVWVDVTQTGAISGGLDDVVHRLPGERLAALGDEEPRQVIVSPCKPALDSAQLVPGDGMLNAETVLQPRHPEPGLREVYVLPAQGDGLGDAQPVAVHHQEQKVVADAVTAFLGGGEEPVDLWLAEIVPAALVAVRRPIVGTLNILTVDHGCPARCKPLPYLNRCSMTFYTRHLV